MSIETHLLTSATSHQQPLLPRHSSTLTSHSDRMRVDQATSALIISQAKEIVRLQQEVVTAEKRGKAYQQGAKQLQTQRDSLLNELQKMEQEIAVTKADAWDEGRRDAADCCEEDEHKYFSLDGDHFAESILNMENPYLLNERDPLFWTGE